MLGVLAALVVAVNTGFDQKRSNTGGETRGLQSASIPAPEAMDEKTETPASQGKSTQTGPQMPPVLAKQVDTKLMEADKAIKAGDYKKAEPLLSEAIGMIDRHAPRDLPQRGEIVRTLARMRFAAGKRGEGVDAVDQHIALLEKSTVSNPMVIASFHELTGILLGNKNLFDESLDRFRQVLEIQKKSNADPAVLASTHAKLAISHARLDEKSTAKQELDWARELLLTAPQKDTQGLDRLEQIAKDYDL